MKSSFVQMMCLLTQTHRIDFFNYTKINQTGFVYVKPSFLNDHRPLIINSHSLVIKTKFLFVSHGKISLTQHSVSYCALVWSTFLSFL